MDRDEARELLSQHLDQFRQRSYSELTELIDDPSVAEAVGASGTRYQLEVLVFWDDKPHANLRVLGAIDDGGLRAFKPLSDGFIVAPDGHFVGE
ncbi:MAG: hypothetical protein ACYS99_00155 [Planctomycetota bacterium]